MGEPHIRPGFPSVNEIVRALVIGGVVGIALIATRLLVAHRRRLHRRSVDTQSLRPWPAVIVFTSTDCEACDPVRDTVFGLAPEDVAREVAYQGDSRLFRSAGIDRVPTVLVIDDRGSPVGVFEGQAKARQIERALQRVGLR